MNAALQATQTGQIAVEESSARVEGSISANEFFFLSEEEMAVQENRRIRVVFRMPRIHANEKLNYLTHAVARDPDSAALVRSDSAGEVASELFGLTLAREIARKIGASLVFRPVAGDDSVFELEFEAECIGGGAIETPRSARVLEDEGFVP